MVNVNLTTLDGIGNQGKAARSARILDEARALVRESNGRNLTMRSLAKRANVSYVTIYNQFGSKRGLAMALISPPPFTQQNVEAHPIDGLFFQLDRILEYYLSDPRLFRPLWQIVYEASEEDSTVTTFPIAFPQWEAWFQRASSFKIFSPDIHPSGLQEQANLLLSASLQAWASGTLSQGALRLSLYFGISLLLAGAAISPWSEAFRARAIDYQAARLSI